MRLSLTRGLIAAAFGIIGSATAAQADAPQVVASIKPVHSLVAGIMDGIGEPHLLLAAGDSPHTYAMRPSDAQALAEADIVFWIGEQLELFLREAIATVGAEVRSVPLIDGPGLVLHEYRESEGDHSDEDHAEHEHAGGADDHDHAGIDGHIWLDPANGRAMLHAIAAALADIDPANAAIYQENARKLDDRLSDLEAQIAAELAPYDEIPYYTFHDSFRYFGMRFGLNSRGAITVSPERQPGARHIAEIRTEIARHSRVCLFTEPQFPPQLVETIVEGTDARTGALDPIGVDLAAGPELYFELIESNANAFARCFSSTI